MHTNWYEYLRAARTTVNRSACNIFTLYFYFYFIEWIWQWRRGWRSTGAWRSLRPISTPASEIGAFWIPFNIFGLTCIMIASVTVVIVKADSHQRRATGLTRCDRWRSLTHQLFTPKLVERRFCRAISIGSVQFTQVSEKWSPSPFSLVRWRLSWSWENPTFRRDGRKTWRKESFKVKYQICHKINGKCKNKDRDYELIVAIQTKC
jgi:hypothetical protein